jgi:hypothetical protein
VFERIIPDEVKLTLQNKTPDQFVERIMEGCELAIKDFQIHTVRFPKMTNVLKIPLIPMNLALGRINDVLEYYYDSLKNVVDDILTYDFRHKPELIAN